MSSAEGPLPKRARTRKEKMNVDGDVNVPSPKSSSSKTKTTRSTKSNVKTRLATKKEMMEKEKEKEKKINMAEPTPTPFEELFYHPGAQKAAFKMFHETLKKVEERKREAQKENLNLRMNKSSPTSTSTAVSKIGPKSPLEGKKVEGQDQSQSPMVGGGSGNGEGAEVVEEEEEEEDTMGKELAMVTELLNRYDATKKKLKAQNANNRNVLSDSDLSDLDEDIVYDDIRAAMEGKSDFLKYSVPQYELKEKLYQMHYAVIENMSINQIVELFNEILPELNEIKSGKVSSQRHELFQNVGLSKQCLRDLTVSEPFTQTHDYRIMQLIEQTLFGNRANMTANNGESLHYISTVLLPEALIRIFAKANNIDVQLAEKEMRFKAGYDGELPSNILETIPVTKEEEKF